MLLFLLLSIFECIDAQTTYLQGKVIEFDSSEEVAFCRIMVNDSVEIETDSNGNFNFSTSGWPIQKLMFLSLGFHRLELRNLTHQNTLKLDQVALVGSKTDAYGFGVILKANGRRDRKAENEEIRLGRIKVFEEASKAYVMMNDLKINAEGCLIILE
jgi:hypothetical protein